MTICSLRSVCSLQQFALEPQAIHTWSVCIIRILYALKYAIENECSAKVLGPLTIYFSANFQKLTNYSQGLLAYLSFKEAN